MSLVDSLGLSVENEADTSPRSDPVSAPWLFGSRVHSLFADFIRAKGANWGANDSRFATWIGSRPDAYYADNSRRIYNLWELKPYSWTKGINPAKYAQAQNQLQGYIDSALRGGPWSAGTCKQLFSGDSWHIGYVKHFGQWYGITIHQDPVAPYTGLVFYTQKKVDNIVEKSLFDRLEDLLRQLLGDPNPQNGGVLIPPPIILPTPVGPVIIP